MQGEKLTMMEKLEILMYKIVIYIPVAITFGLFGFLFMYYFTCFLYPSVSGDFYGTIGLPDMWKNEDEMKKDMFMAKIYTVIFSFMSVNLIASITLTIRTSPGNIPSESEWDMPGSFQ
jgi:hypothetical protein